MSKSQDRSREWYVAAYRSTTALLIIVFLFGVWMLWQQHAHIRSLEESQVNGGPSTGGVSTPAADQDITPSAPFTWTVIDLGSGADCTAIHQQLVRSSEPGMPNSAIVIESLQATSAAYPTPIFSIHGAHDEGIVLRSISCGVEAPIEDGVEASDYWLATLDGLLVRIPAPPIEPLDATSETP